MSLEIRTPARRPQLTHIQIDNRNSSLRDLVLHGPKTIRQAVGRFLRSAASESLSEIDRLSYRFHKCVFMPKSSKERKAIKLNVYVFI